MLISINRVNKSVYLTKQCHQKINDFKINFHEWGQINQSGNHQYVDERTEPKRNNQMLEGLQDLRIFD